MNIKNIYGNIKNLNSLTDDEISFIKFSLQSTCKQIADLGPSFKDLAKSFNEDLISLNQVFPEILPLDTSRKL